MPPFIVLIVAVAFVVMYVHNLVIARRSHTRGIATENQRVHGNEPRRVNTKAFTTVAIIVTVVVTGWIPFFTFHAIISLGPNFYLNTHRDLYSLLIISIYISFAFTNWMDGLIFCLRTKECRKTLARMVRACCGTLRGGRGKERYPSNRNRQNISNISETPA